MDVPSGTPGKDYMNTQSANGSPIAGHRDFRVTAHVGVSAQRPLDAARETIRLLRGKTVPGIKVEVTDQAGEEFVFGMEDLREDSFSVVDALKGPLDDALADARKYPRLARRLAALLRVYAADAEACDAPAPAPLRPQTKPLMRVVPATLV